MTRQLSLTRRLVSGQSARSLLGRRKHEELTYSSVGMSLPGAPAPEGYRDVVHTRVVGRGDEDFRRIGLALMSWKVMSGAGHFIQGETDAVVDGVVVVSALPIGPIAVTAPCRVVRVIADGRSIGFAMGTLPGHPARGEESLVLEHRDDDSVVLTVRAVSAPASLLAKLGGPIGRAQQDKAAKRYLDAAAAIGAEKKLAITSR